MIIAGIIAMFALVLGVPLSAGVHQITKTECQSTGSVDSCHEDVVK
jgi:hypothetical protein